MADYRYVGTELPLFEAARNWKQYFRGLVETYLHGDVLEVGAGIGATTRLFADVPCSRWVCVEPDSVLVDRLRAGAGTLDRRTVVQGTLATLEPDQLFDAVLYVDVLEHIPDDRGELALVAQHLRPQGVLMLLAPAHPWLYTPFDAAVGHCRRYTAASLARIVPPHLQRERLCYLDCVGLLASLGNRLMLRSSMPTAAQVKVWDRMLVPCSRWADRALGYRIGKSVLGIWRAP
ncbi:MAG TPA: class I SAM-dependent methyltransferase [bacterium]|nr:class I SAM-dependent methyltransferase [bacterium]